MSDNSENGPPIGALKFTKPKNVKVAKRAAFGTEGLQALGGPAVAVTGPARNTTLGGIVRRTATTAAAAVVPKPAAAVVPKPKPAAAVAAPEEGVGPKPKSVRFKNASAPALVVGELEGEGEGEGVGAAAVAPPTDAFALPEKTSEEDAIAADIAIAVASTREKLKGMRTAGTKPPPAETAMVSFKDLAATNAKTIQQKILKDSPIEASPEGMIYRPITASTFRDFIVQTYAQFSPTLMRVLREGAAAAKEPKELDKDACKRRDPNKVETFYYQKFVRDYLQRGSPYRGLLVYHGLGTGKTCTSIAAAEALYWGGQKTIYVLTPATLSNNYRRELGKCGFFPLRTNNYWTFMKVADVSKPKSVDFFWLENVLGLPPSIIIEQGGGWIPNPDKPSNWDTLSPAERESIRTQQTAHLNFRFKFIHYNGVTPTILSQLAAAGVAEGKSMFDDAVVIMDEVHNLVRTINGTQIGGKPITKIMETVEPREFTWSTPIGRQRPGFKYPRGYTLYRLLQNAVGCKIIALSATPMINYAQELAILMNIVGGEQRMLQIPLKSMARDPATSKKLTTWAQQHPEIDFYAIEEDDKRNTVLNITPVPYGFAKVIAEDGDYATRGFIRLPPSKVGKVEASRERNMDRWGVAMLRELEAAAILKAGGADEAAALVEAARAKVPTSETPHFTVHTMPLLPDDPTVFIENFVDRKTLKIANPNVLKARASGLVSFYKGGSEELMPRVARNEIVEVPMSDYMFQLYSKARLAELDMEKPPEKEGEEGAAPAKRKGMTAAEADLYAQATKTQQTGFLALSRAACNWVFPEEVPRPDVSIKQQVKLLGAEPDRLIAADLAVDVDGELNVAAAEVGGEDAEPNAAALPDEAPPAAAPKALDATLAGILGSLMEGLEANADQYLNTGLPIFSPKYAAMIENIRRSPAGGPVLVYSQFKTLEGLGIFAAALRASPEQYLPLDIQKDGSGSWTIPDSLMEALMSGRPAYILYTGDQELEKRRLLLQLYNADVGGLPPRLSEQCAALLRGDPDNRGGKVCKVFMITQSGAEGISLFNTRQVHIMEPYWNNVRLQQVIGRAIRLCSHMNLEWDERTVEIFTYLSVFSTEQKVSGSKVLMMVDKGMTTDQMIFDIATKKQMLSDGLFEIAQSSAVDCELHFHEHGEATQCFRFADSGRPMFLYHPFWRKDLQAAVRGATGK